MSEANDDKKPQAPAPAAPAPAPRGLGPLEATLFRGPGPLSETELELVTADVEGFLRAGGAFTWTEWRLFNVQERNCAIAAGNKIALERALLLAAANQGPDAAAQLAAPLDGGQMIADHVVAAASARLREAAAGPRPPTINRGRGSP